jgi:hypothetical protein
MSCDPDRDPSKAAPTSAATSSRSEPTRDPDRPRTGNSQRGKLSLSIKVTFQVPEPISLTCKPESQQIRDHQHPGRFIDDTGFRSTASW